MYRQVSRNTEIDKYRPNHHELSLSRQYEKTNSTLTPSIATYNLAPIRITYYSFKNKQSINSIINGLWLLAQGSWGPGPLGRGGGGTKKWPVNIHYNKINKLYSINSWPLTSY